MFVSLINLSVSSHSYFLQGIIKLEHPCIHVDFPVVLCEVWWSLRSVLNTSHCVNSVPGFPLNFELEASALFTKHNGLLFEDIWCHYVDRLVTMCVEPLHVNSVCGSCVDWHRNKRSLMGTNYLWKTSKTWKTLICSHLTISSLFTAQGLYVCVFVCMFMDMGWIVAKTTLDLYYNTLVGFNEL